LKQPHALPGLHLARAWLEGPVFRCIRFGATGLLIAFSLPLLTVSFLVALACAAGYALLKLLKAPGKSVSPDFRQLWAADEFRFESAVQCYEELIDGFAERQP